VSALEAAACPSRDARGWSRRLTRWQGGLVWWIGLAIGIGCASRPEAPRLSDAPVYRNSREGFRFLVPDGWIQTASSNLPAGDLDGEIFLVRYNVQSRQAGASLQVLCAQQRDPRDLRTYHAGPSFGVRQWEPVGAGETVEIGGKTGERHQYQSGAHRKEVVCFRRGERVYSFVGLYRADDAIAQQQIQRAVRSIVWEH